jgi:uncharacterized Zn-finger protein
VTRFTEQQKAELRDAVARSRIEAREELARIAATPKTPIVRKIEKARNAQHPHVITQGLLEGSKRESTNCPYCGGRKNPKSHTCTACDDLPTFDTSSPKGAA